MPSVADKPLLAVATNDGWNIVNYRAPLIRALLQAGYRIVALAPDGPHTNRIRALGAEFQPIPLAARGKSPFADLQTLAVYRSALRKLRPAALLGFTAKPNIYGSLAAHSLGIPVINNISGLGAVFARATFLTRVVAALYRRALSRSAVVFFQNPDDRAEFEALGLVRPDQSSLLPGSGVDLDHFKPRARIGGSEPVTFIFAARLLWDKGVREFVEAARQLKGEGREARFQILGIVEPEGPTAVPLSTLHEWQAEGTIEYLGSAADVRDPIAAADCMVLPSYYREGVPRVLLEAAAMARPVITTDAPGCREAVADGETGLLCEPRSVQALARALDEMARMSPEGRRALGQGGRRKMEREFDSELVHRAYLDALAKLGLPAS